MTKEIDPIAEAATLRISKTRSALLLKEPFFGLMALRLKLKPSYSTKVMAVSKTTLFFNPNVVVMLPKHSIYFIVAHEVMHIVLLHHFRMLHKDKNDPNEKYANQQKVNFAQDYALNAILIDEGFQVPDEPYSPLYKPEYLNMSAENIFELLDDEPPTEQQILSASIGDTVNEPMDADVAAVEERLLRLDITEAKDAAKMQGKLPGALEEILEEVLEIKVDWRKELSIYFKELQRDGYTWNRPNRRFINEGIYLPSPMNIPTGDIVVCIDTSGSLNNEELEDFMGELNGILQFAKPKKVTVVQCDEIIQSIHEYTPADFPLVIEAKGRGGTNFNPVFDAITAGEIEEPSVLVYFTDLEAYFPEEVPHYNVLWVATGTDEDAPFGTTIHL
mgnify:CR=1 FL=1